MPGVAISDLSKDALDRFRSLAASNSRPRRPVENLESRRVAGWMESGKVDWRACVASVQPGRGQRFLPRWRNRGLGRGIRKVFAACSEEDAPEPRIRLDGHDLWGEFKFSEDYLPSLTTGSTTNERKPLEEMSEKTKREAMDEVSVKILQTIETDKTVTLEDSNPQRFFAFIEENNPDSDFDKRKALFADWKSTDLLFQLTDEEISRQTSLFQDDEVKPGLLRSYLFLAIESEAFHDIRELRADVCYPMLMEVCQDFNNNQITHEEFLRILRMVESYVFRRAICDIPTNSLRQTFSTFMRQVKKDRYLESVKAVFLMLPSYRRFPSDEEFIRQIQLRNLYKFNRRSYWLRRFEHHGRKGRVPVQDDTIEHIMPRNENLNEQWRHDLGDDWRRVHEQYLHTLGNLTLTGYNSEYSDRPFSEKRDMEGGFKSSPLKLNQELGDCEVWNERAIVDRGERLAKDHLNSFAH